MAKEQLCRSVEQNVRNVSDNDSLPVHVPCPADETGRMNSQGMSALRCSVGGRWNWARNRSSFVGLASGRGGGTVESSSVLRKGSDALRISSNGDDMLRGLLPSECTGNGSEGCGAWACRGSWYLVCWTVHTGEMSLKFTTCLGLVIRVNHLQSLIPITFIPRRTTCEIMHYRA